MNIDFNIECLNIHNELRTLHGCPSLELDRKLAEGAQSEAKRLLKSFQCHRIQPSKFGENVTMQSSSRTPVQLSGRQATLTWYAEINEYDFARENQLKCGHFSQIIWRSTKTAGFGHAVSRDRGRVIVVARYHPPGNFTNEWIDNVPPPLDGKMYLPAWHDVGIDSDDDINKPNRFLGHAKLDLRPIWIRQTSHVGELIRPNESSRVVVEIRDIYRLESVHFDRFGFEPVFVDRKGTEVDEKVIEDKVVCYYDLETGDKIKELDVLAQTWADRLNRCHEPSYTNWNFQGQPLGQNVAYRHVGADFSGESLVSKWYSEGSGYNYDDEEAPERLQEICHFAQLLWKSTKHLGVGFVESSQTPQMAFIVCFYSPPGNQPDHFKVNLEAPHEGYRQPNSDL